MELLHELVFDERPVDLAGSVLQDVGTRLFLDLRDGFRDVALEDGRVPRRAGEFVVIATLRRSQATARGPRKERRCWRS